MPKDDAPIEKALRDKAEQHSEEGFWKAYWRIRNEGKPWNHKRVHRVYVSLELPLRRKAKKRLPARIQEPLAVPEELNDTWSIDFVSDILENKRRFRSFNVIDDFNREALHIEVDFSLTSNRVVWVLNQLRTNILTDSCIYNKIIRLSSQNLPKKPLIKRQPSKISYYYLFKNFITVSYMIIYDLINSVIDKFNTEPDIV